MDGTYHGKIKKRSFQSEKPGENSASAHKKSLFIHFMEKASMENRFCFWASKSPQTRMKTNKNGLVIYYDQPRWLFRTI